MRSPSRCSRNDRRPAFLLVLIGPLVAALGILAGTPSALAQSSGRPRRSRIVPPPVNAPVPQPPPPSDGAPGTGFSGEGPAPAEEEGLPEEGPPDEAKPVRFNFQNTEIRVVAEVVSKLTGKNLILDDRVNGKVTIFTPRKVRPDEIFGLFQSVLNVRGFGMIPVGPDETTYKIVNKREIRENGTETLRGDQPPGPWDLYVTQIVPLKYLDASEVAQRLQQLVSREGSLIVADIGTNSVIVTDTQDNMRKLLTILKAIDVKETEQAIEVFDLKYASAADISQKVLDILTQDRPGGQGTSPGGVRRPSPGAAGTVGQAEVAPGRTLKILPYERTNSLIVVAGRMDMDRIRDVITRLDFPTPLGNAKINVVRLKNAQADEMVQVLSAVISGASMSATTTRQASQAGNAALGQTPYRAPQISTGGSTGQVQFSGDVRVTADPSTNSIIVSAAQEDFNTIRNVIEQLDIRRRQVFVEAAILEVTLDDSQTLGLQAQSIFGTSDILGMVRSSLGDPTISQVLADPTKSFPTGFGAAVSSTQTVQLKDATGNTVEVPAAAVLIQALASNGNVNVLSTPNILTTDNVEAQIVVGQNVPFPTGTVYSQGGVTPVQTVERRDVGLTLKITPHIGEGDSVRLEIFQEISSVVPTTNTQILISVGPTTTLRSAETTVVVQDRQPVVIGGLIQDRMTDTVQKIPYLGDIPYLGWLFSVSTQQKEKVNLLILLTPTIIHSEHDLQAVSTKHRKATDQFFEDSGQKNNLEEFLRRDKQLDTPPVPPGAPIPASPQVLIPIPGEPKAGESVVPAAVPGSGPEPRPGASKAPASPVGPSAALAPAVLSTSKTPAAAPAEKLFQVTPPRQTVSIVPVTEPPPPLPEPPRGGLPGAPAGGPAGPVKASAGGPAAGAAPGTGVPAAAEAAKTGAAAPAPTPGEAAKSKPHAVANYGRADGYASPPPGFETGGLQFGLAGAGIPGRKVVRLVVWMDGAIVHDHGDPAGFLGPGERLDLFINGIAPGSHILDVAAEVAGSGAKQRETTSVSTSFSFQLPEAGAAALKTHLAAGGKPGQATIAVD